MGDWDKYRREMRRAVKNNDYAAISSIWAGFQSFCDDHGWPDWWSELEQAYMNSQMLLWIGGQDA